MKLDDVPTVLKVIHELIQHTAMLPCVYSKVTEGFCDVQQHTKEPERFPQCTTFHIVVLQSWRSMRCSVLCCSLLVTQSSSDLNQNIYCKLNNPAIK